MRLSSRKTRIGLIVVVSLLGFAGYEVGLHLWGVYHFHAAEAALERRAFARAITHLNKALTAWPGEPSVRLLAAQTARRGGDYGQAISHLQAFERSKGSAQALILEQKLLEVQRGALGEADMFLSFCKNTPQSPETGLILEALIEGSLTVLVPAAKMGFTKPGGPALAEVERARQAIDLWLVQRSAQADQVQGLVWRGRLHDVMDEHASAVADLRKAVELDPEHFQARWYLAAGITQAEPQAALDHLETLDRLYPHRPEVRFLIATVQRNLGQLGRARDILDELLAANPDFVPGLVERSKVAIGNAGAGKRGTLAAAEPNALEPDLL